MPLQTLVAPVVSRGPRQQVKEPVDERTARTVGSRYQALLPDVLVPWLLDPKRALSGCDLAEALRMVGGSVGSAPGPDA